MSYRVRIDPLAMRQIDQFATYLRDYSEDFAIDQIKRLTRIFESNLGQSPLTWSYFPLIGPPYRGYLFRIGRRTQYWIVYTVNEDARTVDVLSFWNTARDPETLSFRGGPPRKSLRPRKRARRSSPRAR
jgi:mRNA-degrading endonuclease RelE of RelBE toxin-antitoxin system